MIADIVWRQEVVDGRCLMAVGGCVGVLGITSRLRLASAKACQERAVKYVGVTFV